MLITWRGSSGPMSPAKLAGPISTPPRAACCATYRALPSVASIGAPCTSVACSTTRSTPFAPPSQDSPPRTGTGRLEPERSMSTRQPKPVESAPANGSLVESAYRTMRQRILDNVWPPGYRALEQELALELGMSRTPVREALTRLQREGLVEVIPRHGMSVLPVSADDMRDIYEMLTALEAMAAELAVRRKPSEAQLKPLLAASRDMGRALQADDLDAWAAADERFHRHLIMLSGQSPADRRGAELLGPRASRPDGHAAHASQADAFDARAHGRGGEDPRRRCPWRVQRAPSPSRAGQPRASRDPRTFST